MRRLVILCLTVALLPANLPAQQAPLDLSLQQAVRLALERNTEYRASIQETRTAVAKQQQAWSLQQPRLELRLSLQHLPEPPALQVDPISLQLPNPANPGSFLNVNVPVPQIDLAKATATRATLVFSVPLFTSGRIENALKAATLGTCASEQYARARASDVTLQVIQACLQAVIAQQVESVHQQALDVVRAHLQQAEALYAQGIVAQYDVRRAQTELAAQPKRLTDASNQRALAFSLLFNLLDLPQQQNAHLSTPLREVTFSTAYEETLKAAVEASRELQALQLKAQAQRALALSAEAEAKPQVLFSVNLETLTRDLSAIKPHASLTVGLRWNLFDGGYARAVAREHRESAARTELDGHRLRNALALRVKQALIDLESAQQGLKAAQHSVELAQESLRLAERRFATGVGTSVETLDAILALSQAKLQRESAPYQMNMAHYTLLRLTDELLQELDVASQEMIDDEIALATLLDRSRPNRSPSVEASTRRPASCVSGGGRLPVADDAGNRQRRAGSAPERLAVSG